MIRVLLCVIAALALASPASAELDLSRAGVARLDNGLTVIVLEDRTLPVVSVQIIYRSGARDETAGKTGLAHFLEHLAFRASANFPEGGATRAIYDAGGEWHGYTWLDQTAYYATMPADGLDLLLRIEADRMARTVIDPASIEAERGAVITEMHGYENDPDSVLFDAAVAAALTAHPYRNNTIGFERDVAALTAEDARAFYERHYAPGNAVLAIVGDVDGDEALALARQHFDAIPARALPERALPEHVVAIEPLQRGERRTRLAGPVARRHLKLVYHAPAATSPDFASFLVLQQLVSGGSGVNFDQNDWGTPAIEGAALYGVAEDVRSWFIPTADPYLFVISASIESEADEDALEAEIERRLAIVWDQLPTEERMAAARAAVAEQLVFDIQTTEDAAHQLAFFEGIGAYDRLLALPERVAAVTAEDVRRAAQVWLHPERQTVAWYVPAPHPAPALLWIVDGFPVPATSRAARPPPQATAPATETRVLSNQIPAMVTRSTLSPTVTVGALLSAPIDDTGSAGSLVGFGAVTRSGMASELESLIAEVRAEVANAAPVDAPEPSDDPETLLEQMIVDRVGADFARRAAPVMVAVSGAIDLNAVFALLERSFGTLPPPAAEPPSAAADADFPPHVAERIDLPLAQAALGYVVPAPPPLTREGLAWRMLLYVLTHDYEGRLGRAAIADRGLVYYIGGEYRSDGTRGWVTLSIGVDPGRSDAMEALLAAELARLASDPPSAAETEAARRHILGREVSAAQSNEEIVERALTRFGEGGALSPGALAAMLAEITPADLAAAAAAFANGTIMRVDVGAPSGDQP